LAVQKKGSLREGRPIVKKSGPKSKRRTYEGGCRLEGRNDNAVQDGKNVPGNQNEDVKRKTLKVLRKKQEGGAFHWYDTTDSPCKKKKVELASKHQQKKKFRIRETQEL